MLRSSLIVTALSLVGSFLGLLVQVIMAQRYGVGVEIDKYLYAISTPTFVAGMLASLLSYTVVPRLAQFSINENQQNRVVVSLIALVIGVSSALLLVSPILTSIQKLLLPKYSVILSQKDLAELLYKGWLIASAQIILAALCAILTGIKRIITGTTLNLGPYLGMLSFMLMGTPNGALQLANGLLAGTVLSLIIALFLLQSRWWKNWKFAGWNEVRELVLLSPYTIVAMSCFSAYAVVDSYWGPRAGEGALATLGYVQKIIIAVGNLAVAGPSAVLVPKFSEIISMGTKYEFNQVLKKTLISTFCISLLLALVLCIGAEKIIKIMLMRGSFDINEVYRLSAVLKYALPGMIFMLLSVISLRILFCFQGIESGAALIALSWSLIYFVISGLLVNNGPEGLALGYSLAWFIYAMLALLLIKKASLKNFG